MGIFSRIGKKAEGALDKAIDPAKEVDMAILELEQQRQAALQELISYKATAKQLDADIERFTAKATEWERRAVVAVKAGDDEAARTSSSMPTAVIRREFRARALCAIALMSCRPEFSSALARRTRGDQSGGSAQPGAARCAPGAATGGGDCGTGSARGSGRRRPNSRLVAGR